MPHDNEPRLGLSERHLALLLDILAKEAPEHEIRAYGSRVSGSGHEASDLDLALIDEPEGGEAAADTCRKLRQALSNSRLPILVEVHLWSQLPQKFRDEIDRHFVVLQGARSGATSDLPKPSGTETQALTRSTR